MARTNQMASSKRKCPNCLFHLTVKGKCPNYFGRCGIVLSSLRVFGALRHGED